MAQPTSRTSAADNMFRPPVNRAMLALNRDFFQKTVPLAAAKVNENKHIAPCRKFLGDDVLTLERIPTVQILPDHQGGPSRSILLNPRIRPNDVSTWTSRVKDLTQDKKITVLPFDLHLSYNYWTYVDIMQAILPEDAPDELPTGFSTVGHIAHLNLRDQFLPYKHLIAEVILDKNPAVRTVINKTESVGIQSEYRTFQYELLAGDPSMQVEVRELDCTFRFDYSKVYWNSRLNTEHERLVQMFKPGEVVCDVMAGVGPFAVPAGKKQVFVWANDLNPDSHACLEDAISLNKVTDFVRPFNQDGRDFIRRAAANLEGERCAVDVTPKPKSRSRQRSSFASERVILERPRVFNHYVMNLPASAITFLDAFISLYHGKESLFKPHGSYELPKLHVHCFSTKSDDNIREHGDICGRISAQLGHTIHPSDPEVEIWDVRDVAPQKRMFCASFRLPAEVAFAAPR